MSGQFPDVLLPDVLDNLNLESLLLSAMPVCRYWREQACAHLTYWRNLEYTGRDGYVEVCGAEQYATDVPRYKRSLELFLIRLSRTYARPVDIAVLYPDPHVLSALASHLPHVRSLDIVVLVRHWEAAVDILRRTPAPLLESLSLHYHYQQTRESDEQFYPVLPRDLFAGQHTRLNDVRLYDVDLPSVADLPDCFSGITSLVVLNTHQNVQRALPNVFRHRRRLRKLCIYYRVRLEDPGFSNDETWRGLDELGLQFIDNWDVLELPLRDIPCVVMAPWTAQAVIEIVYKRSNETPAPTLEFRPYLRVKNHEDRRALSHLLFSGYPLAIEILRPKELGIPRELRRCRLCRTDIEDTLHALFMCPELGTLRNRLWSELEPVLDNGDRRKKDHVVMTVSSLRLLSARQTLHFLCSDERFASILAAHAARVLETYRHKPLYYPSEEDLARHRQSRRDAPQGNAELA